MSAAPLTAGQGTLLARPDPMSPEKERAMQVQVQTDNHIENRDDLARYVEGVVAGAADRFRDQITSVQVHLHDDNSPGKGSLDDFSCLMEARLAGTKQVAVSHHADNLHIAINSAAGKLTRALDSHFGKLEDRQRHAAGTGQISADIESRPQA
jgi:ribosome-associated translation inhibitor RaiA